MARGRHAKEKPKNYKGLALGAAVGMGATGVVASGGTASAASLSAWDAVAQCESSGLWNRPDGDGGRSSGGLQFQPASWADALAYLRSKGIDTSGYPQGPGHQAYKATKQQQIIAGEALLALQGPGAWTCNAKVGSPLGASMFEGGVNPYAGAPAPVTPPPVSPPVVDPPDAEDGVYVVRAGDYLTKIAAKLKTDGGWKRLYAINRETIGSDPNRIEIGMKLRLPGHEAPAPGKGAGSYTVRAGDTLSKIAASKMGSASKWRALYAVNKKVIGSNPNLIRPGQVLKVPGAAVAKPVQKPKPPVAAPPANSHGYALPVQGRIGDSLIVGSGGSMSRSAGGHSGLDISAPQGTPVVSAAAGTVVSINSSGGAYGLHVVVKHGGTYTLYAHLSRIGVSMGQALATGQQLGNVGSTGNSSGAHLHFEVRNHPTAFTSGTFLNPLTWLRANGVTV